MSESGKIKAAADALAALSESVPVYRDGIQPGMIQVGKAVETVGKAVNMALAPLKLVVWGYEQIEEFLVSRVSAQLEYVPQDRIITPDLIVAGPAVEAMKFAGHKEELREMYARLLAASMDSLTAINAHPAFVEVIRQLTPDEAKLLELFYEAEELPLVDLCAEHEKEAGKLALTTTFDFVRRNFSTCGYQAGCSHPQLTPIYLNNLERLKLIETSDAYLEDEHYEPLMQHPDLLDNIADINSSPGRKVYFNKRIVLITDFGKAFCKVCVQPHVDGAV